MPHTSEKRWSDVSSQVSTAAQNVRDHLLAAEEDYQQLQELFAFVGATAQGLADQLFVDDWKFRESDPIVSPGVFDTEANATELAKATDAIAAMLALHQLFQAATNVAITQSDRLTDLRRMI